MLNSQRIRDLISGNSLVSLVYYFEEIDSTNNFAKTLGEDDALVLTDFQTSGRGRFERKWFSSKGMNLTFSIRKRISILPAENQYVNFFFTYFLYESIIEWMHLKESDLQAQNVHIKWPNDILYGNKKLAGLLIESLPLSQRYVIGIGLNVNQENFGSLENAASLKLICGKLFEPEELLLVIINKYSENFELLSQAKFETIYEKWLNGTKMIGKSCEFADSEKSIKQGIINNLYPDGSIEILINDKKMRFYSGEIRFLSI